MRRALKLTEDFTPDQLTELETDYQIVELRHVHRDLHNFLQNLPDDDNPILYEQAIRLADLCDQFDAVLLPCGSPKFMWYLAERWDYGGRTVRAAPLFAPSR